MSPTSVYVVEGSLISKPGGGCNAHACVCMYAVRLAPFVDFIREEDGGGFSRMGVHFKLDLQVDLDGLFHLHPPPSD